MTVETTSMSAGEYIQHHLVQLTQKNEPQVNIVDFSYINLDTIFFSVFLGLIFSLGLFFSVRKFTTGVPGRFQAAVELIYEFVDDMSMNIIHNEKSRKLVAPLGFSVFLWVFLMNAMDLIPVDLLPFLYQTAVGDSHAYLRVVPTADINTPMALALGILILTLTYNIKIKGTKGWSYELVTAPFGSNFLLIIPNLLLNIIEYFSKMISHAMRLFGNMYAGELVFLLIALLGGSIMAQGDFNLLDPILFLLHVLAGFAWAVFHILIITLQAFIFMVLAFVYIGQAHDTH